MTNNCKCSCEYCKTGEHCGARIGCGKAYSSKNKRRECVNEYCINLRSDTSSHCSDCSYKYHLNKYEKK